MAKRKTPACFNTEISFQAVVIVIESMHEKTDEAMCKLLQSLFRSFILTNSNIKVVSLFSESTLYIRGHVMISIFFSGFRTRL